MTHETRLTRVRHDHDLYEVTWRGTDITNIRRYHYYENVGREVTFDTLLPDLQCKILDSYECGDFTI